MKRIYVQGTPYESFIEFVSRLAPINSALLPQSSAKFTGDRSTSNEKWARVLRDEVNSASRRRRNRQKTSATGPQGWWELHNSPFSSPASFASQRKTRKHSLTSFAQYLLCSSTVRAVLWKLQTPTNSVLRAKRAVPSTGFFVGTIYCNVTIHAKEMLRMYSRESRAMKLYAESSLICMKHRVWE